MPKSPPLALTDTLREIGAEVRRGAHEAALQRALEQWRGRPAAELAELVEALSWLAARDRAPIAPKAGQSQQAAWLERAAEHHPADIDGLVSTILDTTRGALSVVRVVALGEVPPHPRLARALQDLVDEVALRSNWHKRVAEPAVEVLMQIGDPRSVAWARSKVAAWPKRRAVGTRRALEAFLSTHDSAMPSLDAADVESCQGVLAAIEHRAALGRERKLHQAKDGGELLAQVYAEPQRDEPRLVYADWLTERGDPRGEFIVLQIERDAAAPPSRRESELLRQYGKEWLGPLSSLAAATGNVLERGFPAVLRLRSRYDGTFPEGPEWATLHTLDLHAVDWMVPTAPLVTHPRLRRLECLRGASGRHLAELMQVKPLLGITRVEQARWSPSMQHLTEFPVAALPNVRSLGMDHGDPCHPPALAAALDGPLSEQLVHLAWSTRDITQLAPWWPILRQLRGSLRSLSIAQANLVSRDHTKGVVVTLHRDSAQEPFHRVALRCDHAARFMRPAHIMARVIEALDREHLSALRVELPARYRSGEDHERLAALVATIDGGSFV